MLNVLEFCLSVILLVIPILAFTAAKYVRFRTHYFPAADADRSSYLLWIAVVSSVWAFVVEKSKLNRAERIMTLNTGIQATSSAVLYTMAISFALFFFYRQVFFSRIFAVTGCVLTFLLSLLTLHVFRAVLRSKRGPFRVPLRLAILGIEGYEARLAKYLESTSLIPVKVACVIPMGPYDAAEYPGRFSNTTGWTK